MPETYGSPRTAKNQALWSNSRLWEIFARVPFRLIFANAARQTALAPVKGSVCWILRGAGSIDMQSEYRQQSRAYNHRACIEN